MDKERSRRNVIIAAAALGAAAVAIVLVIALSGGDSNKPSASTQASTTSTTGTGTTTGTKPGKHRKKGSSTGSQGSTGSSSAQGTEEQRTRQLTQTIRQRIAGSGVEKVRVRDGIPVDGLLRLIYRKGDRVRLKIDTNRPDLFVVQGFGLQKRGGPPDGVSFDFTATQSGLFGVELHRDTGRTRVAVLVIH
jgi:hypothetical protein